MAKFTLLMFSNWNVFLKPRRGRTMVLGPYVAR